MCYNVLYCDGHERKKILLFYCVFFLLIASTTTNCSFLRRESYSPKYRQNVTSLETSCILYPKILTFGRRFCLQYIMY